MFPRLLLASVRHSASAAFRSNPLSFDAKRLAATLTVLLSLGLAGSPQLRAGNTWTGGGASTNWSDNNNWGGAGPGYGTLTFTTGGTQGTTSNNNSISSMNQLFWNGSATWTLNGTTTLSLFDNGGTRASIENQSTGLVTINDSITFAATAGAAWGEINAVNGGLTFGAGTLTVNGSAVNGIRMFGAGQTTSFNNTVAATGKYFSTSSVNTTVAVGGSFTSGDIYLMNSGTLRLNAGGTVTTSALRLGGDFGTTGTQNQTLGATFALTSASGGQSFAGTVNTVAGNSSNALLIDSQNTSGSNTFSGSVFLDSPLRTQTATGGILLFQGGSIDIKAQTLTVSGSGTTTINEALTSSLTAGGSLVKTGTGTLLIQTTGNTYTGTSAGTLNANGTQISGGTLGIVGDTSLGVAPGGAYNNIQFTGSGTLQDTSNNISLNANRNVSVASGATATLDSNGNTFTVNGVVNGTGGNLAVRSSTGNGNVVLTGNNTFTGSTTINSGTLTAAATAGNKALGATTLITVNAGGTLALATGNQINNAATMTLAGGRLNANSALVAGLTTTLGALTLTASSIIDLASGAGTAGNTNLTFAASNGATWTGGATLSIYNWGGTAANGAVLGSGTDSLHFGATSAGLNSGQLAQIIFYSDTGTTSLGSAAILSDGSVVPVPEPVTVIAGALALGLLGYRQRKRLFGTAN